MRTLTIVLMSNLYPPQATGSTSQITGLARYLCDQGHKVIVIATRFDKTVSEFEESEGISIYRLRAFRLPRMKAALNFAWLNYSFTPANILRVQAIIRKSKPDIIHLHNHMFDMAFHAVRAKKKFGVPLVISIHTIITHPNPIYNFLLQAVDRSLLRIFVVRKADALICADQIVGKYITEAFGIKPTTVIPYAVNPLPQPPQEKVTFLRQKFNLGIGPIILSLGHIHQNRDRKEIIQILPELRKTYPKIKLVIVGDVGTQVTGELASKLGVNDCLVLTGAIPHSEVSAYIQLADIEMHWFDPRHPHRTIGPSGMEVMGMGKVIATIADENILGDGVLRDGKNIILVDLTNPDKFTDRLIRILENKNDRERIGKNARETANQYFRWDRIGAKTLDVYNELLRDKRSNN